MALSAEAAAAKSLGSATAPAGIAHTHTPAFGTWRVDRTVVRDAVLAALAVGYRHIDCAPIYQNQPQVGEALQHALATGLVADRSELFITSKLPPSESSPERALPSVRQSVADLACEQVDALLIVRVLGDTDPAHAQHWPVRYNGSEKLGYSPSMLMETWRECERAVECGLARRIGVSNTSPAKLSRLMEECSIMPSVNQLELHPYLPQDDVLQWHREAGIEVTAYSALASPARPDAYRRADDPPSLLENDVICAIARRHGKSPSQILLKWAIQRGTTPISRSVTRSRLQENIALGDFALTDADNAEIATLAHGPHAGFRWNKGEHMVVPGQDWTGLWDDAWLHDWRAKRAAHVVSHV